MTSFELFGFADYAVWLDLSPWPELCGVWLDFGPRFGGYFIDSISLFNLFT